MADTMPASDRVDDPPLDGRSLDGRSLDGRGPDGIAREGQLPGPRRDGGPRVDGFAAGESVPLARDAGVRATALTLAAWFTVAVGSFVWGYYRHMDRPDHDRFPPLHGHPRLPYIQLLPVVALGALSVYALPKLARRVPWKSLLLLGWACGAGWAVALAGSKGWYQGFTRLPQKESEYRTALPAVGDDPMGFLRTFTENLPNYAIHVKGHPPLPVLIFWALEKIGLHGPGWAAAVIIAAGTASIPAIMITLRVIAGENTARLAFPYLCLAPAMVFVATASDAIFLGVGAWGVALLAIAASRRRVAETVGVAVVAGLFLGTLPYLSYGLLPLAAVPLAVLIVLAARPGGVRRAIFAVIAALAGVAFVAAVFTDYGFWWPDGVAATHDAWASGGGSKRSFHYRFVGNIAVLGLLIGPAATVGLVRLRDCRVLALVGAGLLGVMALNIAGVTRGEVERIWLPYALWMVPAAVVLRSRYWLAAQVATALVVQAFVRSPW